MLISRFRTSTLWHQEELNWLEKLKSQIFSNIAEVKIERRFAVETDKPLSLDELATLDYLLSETFEPLLYGPTSRFNGLNSVFEIGPRLAIVTPKSTNAVAIFNACGLNSIIRAEQFLRFNIVMEDGNNLSPEQAEKLTKLLYDRMTEQPYLTGIESFKTGKILTMATEVPLLEQGIGAIFTANREFGLAIDKQMAEYIFGYYANTLKRNPTIAELFMFGQLNSEHCRHLYFKGQFIINGQNLPYSGLFDMIKATMRLNPGNVLSAYKDNGAVFAPFTVNRFVPQNPILPSAYGFKRGNLALTLKVETHNHPTTICAFPGAATGSGGEIRDRQMIGRGGVPIAGLACYYVGSLNYPDLGLSWEKQIAPHPARFQTPLEIIIEASNGASDYGNKFGQPLILGSFTSFEQQVNADHYGYRKTCMIAGGIGQIRRDHVEKKIPEAGQLVVQLGGDAYWIGLGGGSSSSKDAGGQTEDLDFDSVQRDNAEMENRVNEVIRACSELGLNNPIVTCTDLGAGGECVALTEIVDPVGARYELRSIPSGDATLPVYVLWCNESQERVVVVINANNLSMFKKICGRNRCPMAVVGEITGDGKLTVTDSWALPDAAQSDKTPIDLDMKFLLADLPQKIIDCQRLPREPFSLWLPQKTAIIEMLERVLRLPKVASKHFLTRKVDRSVGGLVAKQQTVGPLQLTLADCAVVANGYIDLKGAALAIGEQPLIGLVNTIAGGRMSVAEALTNIVWALVEGFAAINFSATWQWPCNQPGEDARLYDTVKAVSDLCQRLGLRIPVGKDSVSMTAWTKLDGQPHAIKAPGTVQIVACAPCADIRKVITPDIKSAGKSKLMFIDLAYGKQRLGGSALAQVFSQLGDEAPDVEDPELLRNGFMAVQELIKSGYILAGHDRSDGGLITCLLEMAFAGNCGFTVNLRGKSRSGNQAVNALFAEELGLVIEYLPHNEKAIKGILRRFGLNGCFHVIGATTASDTVKVKQNKRLVLTGSMKTLRLSWLRTGTKLDTLQTAPDFAKDSEQQMSAGLGLKFQLSFLPKPTPRLIIKSDLKHKVAVLRDEGANGHRELAAALFCAGFSPFDVTLADIAGQSVSLEGFRGLAIPGGFTYGDVLDAGKGMAGVMKFNPVINAELKSFFDRNDTFSIGICNGCQTLALLNCVPASGIDPKKQPRFVKNKSGIFESRFAMVKILPSPSIFFKRMENSILGVWVAHGQGQCYWPDESIFAEAMDKNLAPLRFVDELGVITERYPFNPNGSRLGIAAICSSDGRHLALMPHPERLFLPWQWPYWPAAWRNIKHSPWLTLFQNARQWCDDNH